MVMYCFCFLPPDPNSKLLSDEEFDAAAASRISGQLVHVDGATFRGVSNLNKASVRLHACANYNWCFLIAWLSFQARLLCCQCMTPRLRHIQGLSATNFKLLLCYHVCLAGSAHCAG